MDCQKKQRERLMGSIVYSPYWFRTVIPLVVRRVNYILTLTWDFRRCSFRQSGQCEGLNKWNEWQNWLHAFIYVYGKLNKITDQSGSRWFICTATTMKKFCLLIALLMSIQLASAQRKTVIVETPTNQVQDDGMVLKRKVAIGRFSAHIILLCF